MRKPISFLKANGQLQAIFLAMFLFIFTGISHAQLLGQQGNKLVGTNPIGYSPQGASVAISADGNTAIVGGDQDNANVGGVWFYTRTGVTWAQQGPKMIAADATGVPRQGFSVSISADGNTAVIGGYLDSNPLGAAYVFTRTAGVWSQQGSKLVGTGSTTGPIQGWSVGISGDGNTILVGGQGDNNYAGAVWAFTRTGGVWTQEGNKITAIGGVGTTAFGQSISLSHDGNTAIVGAKNDNNNIGSAYVLIRSAGVWSQPAGKLVGNDAVGQAWQGISVGMSGDGNTAIVGGYLDNSHVGAAWVYTRSGNNWTQQGSKLVSNDYTGTVQQGSIVSLSYDGNRALVSGWNDNSAVGCGWLYTRTGGVWTQSGSKMRAGDQVGVGKVGTGAAISADGSTVIMGGPYDNGSIGAAWIFATCTSAPPKAAITGAVSQAICSGYTLKVADTSGVGQFISSYSWSDGSTGPNSNPVTAPGTYTVTITNSCGNTSTASQVITTVNASPATTITGSNYFCAGSSIILTASDAAGTAGPFAYNWSNGSTTANSNPISTVGTYTVSITNGIGCTVSASRAITSNPILVTSTAGAAACYSSLRAAFDAINNGLHTGSINIRITANSTETATCTLIPSGTGSAFYTDISIQPSGGAARTITCGLSNFPLIDLNGADNVTIDGLNTDGNALTFINTSVAASAGTATIRFVNDASNNKVTNCTIMGNAAATIASTGNNGTIVFGGATTTGNDNNTISYCNITSSSTSSMATRHIYAGGTTGKENDGLVIDHNNISNFFRTTLSSAAVDISTGSSAVVISNNKFYQTATRTFTTVNLFHRAISIDGIAGNGYQVLDNTIGYSDSVPTGKYTFAFSNTVSTTASLVPIYLNVGATTASSLQGNIIAGITISGNSSGTGTSAPFKGIYVANGLVNIGDIKGNIIGDTLATGSITYTSSATAAADVAGILVNNTAGNPAVNNNVIGGIAVNTSAPFPRSFYGIRLIGTTISWQCNNNIIGGSIANSITVASGVTAAKVNGIYISGGNGSFTGNIIRNMTTAGGTGTGINAGMIGINLWGTGNQALSQNQVYNLSTTATTITEVLGIEVNSSATNTIERNLVYGLNSSATVAGATLTGIRIDNGTGLYKNNMISVGANVNTPVNITGFNETAGINSFLHNSVYIGGAPSTGAATIYSAGFLSTLTANTRSNQNNIFENVRNNGAGATSKHYAISLAGSNGLTIDYNLYHSAQSGAIFGRFNNADITDLDGWKTATGQDAGSNSGDPYFKAPANAAADLRINSEIEPSLVDGKGTSIGITDDFDGQVRAALTPTDIGANAYIQTRCTWTGAIDTVWSKPGNWSCGVIPVVTSNVYIPSAATNMPWVDITDAICNNIDIAAGAVLTIGTGNMLEIKGAATNAGTFTVPGKAKFSGTTQTIPGAAYAQLEIDGAAAKTLLGAVSIGNTLTITSGTLLLGAFDLQVAASGSITGANASSYIVINGTGALKQQGIGTAGRTGAISFPVGSATSFTPISINNTGTADEFAVRVIDHVFDAYDANDVPTGTVQMAGNVDKTWIVKETVPGGSDVTLGFQWNSGDELPGFMRSGSRASHYTGNLWLPAPVSAATGVGPYSTSLSNVTTFSPFGVGNTNSALPLRLLSFTGKEVPAGISLQWATANEINTAGFDVERSVDGSGFVAIGNVPSQAGNRYAFVDDNMGAGAQYFYRLKMRDRDGSFTYSSVLSFTVSSRTSGKFLVYPNPATGDYLYIQPTGSNTAAQVAIVDMNGRSCYSTKLTANTITNGRLQIPVNQLPAGVYVLKISDKNGENIQVTKFTVVK
jgi:hypothetical protein